VYQQQQQQQLVLPKASSWAVGSPLAGASGKIRHGSKIPHPPPTPLLQLGRVARRFGSDLYGASVSTTLGVSKGHFSGHGMAKYGWLLANMGLGVRKDQGIVQYMH
jgi:hypothetical protein